MTPLYALLFHPGYEAIEIAIARDGVLLESQIVAKHQASKELLVTVDALLDRCRLTLSDCSFFVVHKGPAPFTTLRVTLATVNGLAYATKKPIVGVDGLDAFVESVRHNVSTPYIAVLLNAFCDDLYFALYDVKNGMIAHGCERATAVCARIEQLVALPSNSSQKLITLVGNGVLLHEKLLQNSVLQKSVIPEPLPLLASLASINDVAWKLWDIGQSVDQVLPLYLKASSTSSCPILDETLCSV